MFAKLITTAVCLFGLAHAIGLNNGIANYARLGGLAGLSTGYNGLGYSGNALGAGYSGLGSGSLGYNGLGYGSYGYNGLGHAVSTASYNRGYGANGGYGYGGYSNRAYGAY